MRIELENQAATAELGKKIARSIIGARGQGARTTAVYLFGDLGSGKTTLTAALVSALPGGELAEVASPSFTICHEYPTTPPVFHADLYRLGRIDELPDDVALTDGSLLIVEWSENLACDAYAPDRLEIRLSVPNEPSATSADQLSEENTSENLDIFEDTCEKKRSAFVQAFGEAAIALSLLSEQYPIRPPASRPTPE